MLGGKKVKYGGQTGIEVGTEVHFIHPETNATRAGVVERRDFTKVETRVVFPVPAYPFNKNKLSLSILKVKSLNNCNSLRCFDVGEY